MNRWDTGTSSGGTFLTCSWHQGCGEQFYGSAFTTARGARKEAKTAGWLVNQTGGRVIGYGRTLRLDYCSEHARRERERRGLTQSTRSRARS